MDDWQAKLQKRIADNVEVVGECHVWIGSKSGSGYGRISIRGRKVCVHRVVATIHYGPILRGEVVDHLCSNRACCRPEHLEIVSQSENVKRGQAHRGPRTAKGRFATKG